MDTFWCKNCLNMSTRPRITFDKRGWCNACQWMEDKKVDAVATAHLFNFIGSSLEDSRTALLKEGFNLAKWDVNICESMKGFFSTNENII